MQGRNVLFQWIPSCVNFFWKLDINQRSEFQQKRFEISSPLGSRLGKRSCLCFSWKQYAMNWCKLFFLGVNCTGIWLMIVAISVVDLKKMIIILLDFGPHVRIRTWMFFVLCTHFKLGMTWRVLGAITMRFLYYLTDFGR